MLREVDFTAELPPTRVGPSGSCPIKLKAEQILANDVHYPGDYNPHNVKLWVIGHVYGPVAMVWASCEQDALDEAWDKDLLKCFAVDAGEQTEDEATRESYAYLGNASEPADLTDCWMNTVPWESLPEPLKLAFAEAKGACVDSLGDL